MRIWLNFKNFHHLIPQMIDDFYGDSALLGLVEGAGGVAVEGCRTRRIPAGPEPLDCLFVASDGAVTQPFTRQTAGR